MKILHITNKVQFIIDRLLNISILLLIENCNFQIVTQILSKKPDKYLYFLNVALKKKIPTYKIK